MSDWTVSHCTVLWSDCTQCPTAHSVLLHTVSYCTRCPTAHSVILHAVSDCTQCPTAHGVLLHTVHTAHSVILHAVSDCTQCLTAHSVILHRVRLRAVTGTVLKPQNSVCSCKELALLILVRINYCFKELTGDVWDENVHHYFHVHNWTPALFARCLVQQRGTGAPHTNHVCTSV